VKPKVPYPHKGNGSVVPDLMTDIFITCVDHAQDFQQITKHRLSLDLIQGFTLFTEGLADFIQESSSLALSGRNSSILSAVFFWSAMFE